MPTFRVIGGPYDGSTWQLSCCTEGERVFMKKHYDNCIEHIYELRLASRQAIHKGWRRMACTEHSRDA